MYKLVVERINGQATEPTQHAEREFKNDVTAIKEFRSQVRSDLLKLYDSVKCSVYDKDKKIFEFDEHRSSHKQNAIKFLNRVDLK